MRKLIKRLTYCSLLILILWNIASPFVAEARKYPYRDKEGRLWLAEGIVDEEQCFGRFVKANNLTIDEEGKVYIIDGDNVYCFTSEGKELGRFGYEKSFSATETSTIYKFTLPRGIAITRDFVYILEEKGIAKFNRQGLLEARFNLTASDISADEDSIYLLHDEGRLICYDSSFRLKWELTDERFLKIKPAGKGLFYGINLENKFTRFIIKVDMRKKLAQMKISVTPSLNGKGISFSLGERVCIVATSEKIWIYKLDLLNPAWDFYPAYFQLEDKIQDIGIHKNIIYILTPNEVCIAKIKIGGVK